MSERPKIKYIDIILFNKPYNVLSQFTDNNNRANLSNFINVGNFYSCGRLDRDSEGLLVLTDNGRMQHLISHPGAKIEKMYSIQVDGIPSEADLQKLRDGITLKDGPTLPCDISAIAQPEIPARIPDIRKRKHLPTSWLKIILKEGRNRQIRRMTAAIGFPTLRLVRRRIGAWHCDDLQPGENQQLRLQLTSLPDSWQRYIRKSQPVGNSSRGHVATNHRRTPRARR